MLSILNTFQGCKKDLFLANFLGTKWTNAAALRTTHRSGSEKYSKHRSWTLESAFSSVDKSVLFHMNYEWIHEPNTFSYDRI